MCDIDAKMTVTLGLKEKNRIPLEAENITPDVFAGKSASEIEDVSVWEGNTERSLGDFFTVSVEGSTDDPAELRIVISGGVPRVKRIGEAMTAGCIHVKGDVDMHLGNNMTGGCIEVDGDASAWAGREMKGGEIHIAGDAGYYLGAGYRGEDVGMTGGTITVDGDAGDYVGEHMGGGEIHIAGDAGLFPGAMMRGGKIVIDGDTELPGAEMRGGEIVVAGNVKEFVPSFKVEGEEEVEGAKYNKYTGDLNIGGEGAIYAK